MRIDIACFTDPGESLGGRLRDALRRDGDGAECVRCGRGGPALREWTAERFARTGALVFIGAAAIAVRAIAPLAQSKTRDPAVLVVDEGGSFVVSLLSGHIGGANALTRRVARILGATPVVTTATDVQNVFAVDVWARRRGYALVNPESIKTVSSALLRGDAVRFRCAFPVAGPLPDGIEPAPGTECDLLVDIRSDPGSRALLVVPPAIVLGVGCRRGVAAETLERAFLDLCGREGIRPEALAAAASVDFKRDEAGIAAFAQGRGVPFVTFPADALSAMAGEFTASDFVKATAGVDNVCERSAMAAGGDSLIVRKAAANGVALAMALRRLDIDFHAGNGEDA